MTRGRGGFAFDHADVSAVKRVRCCGQSLDVAVVRFTDASQLEKPRHEQGEAIQRATGTARSNAVVSVACIVPRTASRRWATYELLASIERGKRLPGVYLRRLNDESTALVLASASAPFYEQNPRRSAALVQAVAGR